MRNIKFYNYLFCLLGLIAASIPDFAMAQQTENATTLLKRADELAIDEDYKNRIIALGNYKQILANQDDATENQKQKALSQLKELFFFKCSIVNKECLPIKHEIDASLEGVKFDKTYVDFEKWGTDQQKFENIWERNPAELFIVHMRINEIIAQARKGDVSAMLIAADYFDNSGMITDGQNLANEYYRTAANLGNAYANGQYAYRIYDGKVRGMSKRDAIEYYKKAVALGDAESMHQLALIYMKQNKKPEAMSLLEAAGNRNYLYSMLILGSIYEEKQDFDTSFKWRKKAFDINSSDLISRLGISQMFSALFNEEIKTPLEQWVKEKQTKDPTLNEFIEIDKYIYNSQGSEAENKNIKDFISLASKGGYGSVLAAEKSVSFYNLTCTQLGEMSYTCKKLSDKVN